MKNNKILLTTTASFYKTIEETDLKDFLAKKGIEAVLEPRLMPPFPFGAEKVFGLVAGHNPMGELVRADAETAKRFPNLKIVSPFGIGVDHIDFKGLKSAGVNPITLPHFSKRTVAELTIGFLFALARNILPQTSDIKNRIWKRMNGQNIYGKTLGIIGLGNIGKETAILARGVGLKVLASDLVYDEEFNKKYDIQKTDLDTLLKKSDFITLHVPLTEGVSGTRNLMDKRAFSLMKEGAIFINVARGEVVDDKALLEALSSGRLAGAALDVFSSEPPFENETLYRIIRHPNVITTPHIGAFTPEIRYEIAKKICEEFSPFCVS